MEIEDAGEYVASFVSAGKRCIDSHERMWYFVSEGEF